MYDLINEYENLVNRKALLEADLVRLPKGYISKKKINGSVYCYLRCKADGRDTSEYLKAENVARVTEELALRKQYEAELPTIATRLEELEQAAKLIGNGVDRTLMLLRLGAGMDSIAQDDKDSCISFANAMNAIEGVPPSKQTANDLALWKSGSMSYMAVFAATLKRHGFAVEV